MVDINEYTRETTCEYKGEVYSVRDNGAVMRHIRDGKKARKLDNVWTFGTKDKTKGYMMINSHRVHIIVAKAFIPGNEDGNMIVDHIDTNRCNNRVENLRWLTRLENVLLNEATLKKVTFLCGGDIQKFIENPSCLQDLTGDNQDIMWMRTVTAEEAKKAWERISEWAKRPNSTFKMMKQKERAKDFDEWLKFHETKEVKPANPIRTNNFFAPKPFAFPEVSEEVQKERDEWHKKEIFASQKNESLTKNALQVSFYEKMQFPLCPDDIEGGLDAYAKNLEIDKVIACNQNGDEYTIESLGWTWEWDAIQVSVKLNGQRTYQCIHISYEDGKYLHSQGESKSVFRFCDSPNVLQCGAVTQCYFPLCPKEGNITLEEYAEILQKGVLFEKNPYSDGYVIDREIAKSEDGSPILYVGVSMPESFPKNLGDMIIFIENGKVIHQIGRTFFDEKSLQRTFCKMRGQEWNDDEEVFDDYC